MDLFDLGGRAFRARLRKELPGWRVDGLVSDAGAADLARRYHLDEEGVSAAAAAIYTLGALLIGGGVISFVAWNWDRLGRAAKLSILLAALLAAIWGCARVSETQSLYVAVPYAVAVPFLPLAWRLRSRLLFLATALSTLVAMTWAATAEAEEAIAFAAAPAAGAALLLGFSCWAREGTPAAHFGRVSNLTGLLVLAPLLFLCSFEDVAGEASWTELSDAPWTWSGFAVPAVALAVALLVGARRALLDRPATLCAALGVPLVALALLPARPDVTGALAANVVLAAIVIAAVTSAVRTLERAPFWAGSVLGVTVILSRFAEFDTELWLKAIVFLACGMSVIWFGVVFERRRRVAREVGSA